MITHRQKADLQEFRNEWQKTLSGYGKTERKKTEELINRLYLEKGFLQPEKIIWCDNPIKAFNVIEILSSRQRSFDFMSQTSEEHFKEQLLEQHSKIYLGNSLFLSFDLRYLRSELKLESQFRKHNFFNLNVNEELLQSLNFLVALECFLITSVESYLSRNTAIKDLQALYIGQHNLKSVAFYLYYNYHGVNFDENTLKILFLFADIARSCCWWWPFENAVIICDRPKSIEWDNDEQIHAMEKPAIKFCDGWSLYAFHGRSQPSPKQIERR